MIGNQNNHGYSYDIEDINSDDENEQRPILGYWKIRGKASQIKY